MKPWVTGKVKPPRGPGGSQAPVSQDRAPQPRLKHSPSEVWSERPGQWSVCSASSCRCCSYGKTRADPGRWTTLCALWVSQSQEPADHRGEGPLTALQGRVARAGGLGAGGASAPQVHSQQCRPHNPKKTRTCRTTFPLPTPTPGLRVTGRVGSGDSQKASIRQISALRLGIHIPRRNWQGGLGALTSSAHQRKPSSRAHRSSEVNVSPLF